MNIRAGKSRFHRLLYNDFKVTNGYLTTIFHYFLYFSGKMDTPIVFSFLRNIRSNGFWGKIRHNKMFP